MDWQQLVSFGIVAAAAALLFRGRFRRRSAVQAAEKHCGCSSASASSLGYQGSIVFRARKGQRREILVKMK